MVHLAQSETNLRGVLFATLLASVVACSGTAHEGEVEGLGSTKSGLDLFGCELERSCPQIRRHISPNDDPEATACAGELVASGSAGVISALSAPGGGHYAEETLVVLRGDGTALVQTRETDCNCLDAAGNVLWEPPSEHMICDVHLPAEMIQACETDAPECQWWPWGHLENCIVVESVSCDGAEALLAADS